MFWMPFWRFSVLFQLILSHFGSILGPPGTNFSMFFGDTGFAMFFGQFFSKFQKKKLKVLKPSRLSMNLRVRQVEKIIRSLEKIHQNLHRIFMKNR